MVHNGLAKLRGRLKQLSYQTVKEASRINLFIFLSKPILVACWCLLVELTHEQFPPPMKFSFC